MSDNATNMDDIRKMFTVSAPVHKCNPTTTPGYIAGAYLISMDNYDEYLKENSDMANLTEDTVLFFDTRHLYEITCLLYGAMAIVPKDKIYCIIDLINQVSGVYTYHWFKEVYSDLIKEVKSFMTNDEFIKRLTIILDYIWFLPYDKIDNLVHMAVDESNRLKEVNKDGTDNKTN